MIITGNTIIEDVLSLNPDFEDVLFEAGLRCAGCSSAHSETLEEACEVHGVDLNKLLTTLNKDMGNSK